MKILVIDDDDHGLPLAVTGDVMLFQEQDSRWRDTTVLAAQTGEEGRRLLQQETPDFVLLNMAVPGGRDVLRDIRQMSSVPVVPVVDRAAEQDLVREFGLGAEDYVTKPFGAGVLIRVILVVLRLGGKVPRALEPGVAREDPVRDEQQLWHFITQRRRVWRQPRTGFRRFLRRARTALAAARDEARELGSPSIWAEHLLLGVIRADAGTTCAPQMLRTKLRRARSVVASRLGRKQPVPDHEPELSLQAKRVLARSMAHADRRGHGGVDLEHLLLGLLDVLEESERPTLRALELDPKDVRATVERRLGQGETS
jgi:DNA-binding response OmpR family regulator